VGTDMYFEDTPSHEEDEETMITPRFDGEETRTARPVVPLDSRRRAAVIPSKFTRYPSWRGLGSWPLALVLGSAFIGSVLGGAGLYLYQQRSAAEASTSEPRAEVSQPAPHIESSPTPETLTTPEPTPQPDAEISSVEELASTAPVVSTTKENGTSRDDREKSQRDVRGRDDSTTKRGKKGDRDNEPLVGDQRPHRVSDREPSGEENESEVDGRESRRVGSIIYPRDGRWERRERRRQRQTSVDRIRGIFEGQPD
jgi:hypothetical protein